MNLSSLQSDTCGQSEIEAHHGASDPFKASSGEDESENTFGPQNVVVEVTDIPCKNHVELSSNSDEIIPLSPCFSDVQRYGGVSIRSPHQDQTIDNWRTGRFPKQEKGLVNKSATEPVSTAMKDNCYYTNLPEQKCTTKSSLNTKERYQETGNAHSLQYIAGCEPAENENKDPPGKSPDNILTGQAETANSERANRADDKNPSSTDPTIFTGMGSVDDTPQDQTTGYMTIDGDLQSYLDKCIQNGIRYGAATTRILKRKDSAFVALVRFRCIENSRSSRCPVELYAWKKRNCNQWYLKKPVLNHTHDTSVAPPPSQRQNSLCRTLENLEYQLQIRGLSDVCLERKTSVRLNCHEQYSSTQKDYSSGKDVTSKRRNVESLGASHNSHGRARKLPRVEPYNPISTDMYVNHLSELERERSATVHRTVDTEVRKFGLFGYTSTDINADRNETHNPQPVKVETNFSTGRKNGIEIPDVNGTNNDYPDLRCMEKQNVSVPIAFRDGDEENETPLQDTSSFFRISTNVEELNSTGYSGEGEENCMWQCFRGYDCSHWGF